MARPDLRQRQIAGSRNARSVRLACCRLAVCSDFSSRFRTGDYWTDDCLTGGRLPSCFCVIPFYLPWKFLPPAATASDGMPRRSFRLLPALAHRAFIPGYLFYWIRDRINSERLEA